MVINRINEIIENNNLNIHDLALGILIGYHRILEVGKVHVRENMIINSTKNTTKIFSYKEINGLLPFDNKQIIIAPNIDNMKSEKRINVINNLEQALDIKQCETYGQRRLLRSANKFFVENKKRIRIEEITEKTMDDVYNIYSQWSKFKEKEKNIWQRTYPSYWLALNRCIGANIPLYKKIVYYKEKPFAFRVDDIFQKNRAYLISFSSLYFLKQFPPPLSNYVTVWLYEDLLNNFGIKEVNTGMPMNKGLKNSKSKFVNSYEITYYKSKVDPIKQDTLFE